MWHTKTTNHVAHKDHYERGTQRPLWTWHLKIIMDVAYKDHYGRGTQRPRNHVAQKDH